MKVVFIDCGDTLVDESTQIFDKDEVVVDVEFYEKAEEILKELHDEGYKIVLVADGKTKSFENIFRKIGFMEKFDGFVTSEAVGALKPDVKMFETAFLGLPKELQDKSQICMVGNNLRRDIKGANQFGITSIWMNWSPRYFHEFEEEDWKPDYEIHAPSELKALLETL